MEFRRTTTVIVDINSDESEKYFWKGSILLVCFKKSWIIFQSYQQDWKKYLALESMFKKWKRISLRETDLDEEGNKWIERGRDRKVIWIKVIRDEISGNRITKWVECFLSPLPFLYLPNWMNHKFEHRFWRKSWTQYLYWLFLRFSLQLKTEVSTTL